MRGPYADTAMESTPAPIIRQGKVELTLAQCSGIIQAHWEANQARRVVLRNQIDVITTGIAELNHASQRQVPPTELRQEKAQAGL